LFVLASTFSFKNLFQPVVIHDSAEQLRVYVGKLQFMCDKQTLPAVLILKFYSTFLLKLLWIFVY